jgi:hypothetical protein
LLQERDQPNPWSPSDAPETFISAMARGMIGSRFAITRLEGKWKMNQNREAQDPAGVVKGLGVRRGADNCARSPKLMSELTRSCSSSRSTQPADAIILDPSRAVSGTRPQDREIALIERRIAVR